MFISLYTTRLILNSLGATDFGIFNIVGGAIAMLGFLNAAMAGATQRFMSYAEGEGNKDKQKSIFNVSVVLHFLIALAVGIALLVAGYFFFNGILNIPADRMHAARMVYYFMIISTMLTVMTVPYDAVLNAHENMLYYAIVGIIESVLKLGVALVVVHTLADKLIIYGGLMASISLTVMIVMRVYCHKHYAECEFAPRKHWHKGLMKEMSGFAGWNFLNSSTAMVSNYGAGIILNFYFGTLLNAAQGIANQLSGQLMSFSNTMLKALNPVIAKSEGGGNRELMLQASMTGCKISFCLLAFFAIPFLIEIPYIFQIWLKNVPEWAITFGRLEIIRNLSEQLIIALQNAINAEGNIKQYSIFRSIGYILPMPLSILAFHFGLDPTWLYAIWIFFGSIVGGGIVFYFCKRNCGFSITYYLRSVIYPCLTIVIISAILGSLPTIFNVHPSFFRLILTFGISMSIFAIVLWHYGFNKSEKEIAERSFRTIYSKIQKK